MGKTVTHLIVGLGKGGAETMLYQVLKYRTDAEINHRVISLGASSYYEEPIRELGFDVEVLPIRKRPVRTLLGVVSRVRGTDTLCCWMYHANFIGYIAGRLAGVRRIVWCIRHSNLDLTLNKRMTLRMNRICAGWSGNVAAVAYNGERARSVHEAIGYCTEKSYVLDNGCDSAEYAPEPSARRELCRELDIGQEKHIVLSVTKDTSIKDVPTFLRAFSALHRDRSNTAAVLCGVGIKPESERMISLCEAAGLHIGKNVFLLGMRHDVPKLLAACDLFVLHSAGEAFPNALLQAMSCACLCVSTDVGDVRRILADDGCIVPPGDTGALAEKMRELLELPESASQTMRARNRETARTRFDIRSTVRSYEELF